MGPWRRQCGSPVQAGCADGIGLRNRLLSCRGRRVGFRYADAGWAPPYLGHRCLKGPHSDVDVEKMFNP